jgi:F-type H+-transporting ATPase subunit epsilon
MDKTYHLEIVTPRRIVFSGEVLSMSAPGLIGGFQVLHNHAPFLSSLKEGEIKLIEHSGSENHYATSGGFIEVRDNKVILLAETVERVDEINIERAKASRDRAQKRIVDKSPDIDIDRAKLAFSRAVNRLKIAGIS